MNKAVLFGPFVGELYWEFARFAPMLPYMKTNKLAFEISKSSWGASRIVVVANGSFLLNLPLVNHQHRLLAGQLIECCRPFEKIAFLESEQGGPLVLGPLGGADEDALRMRVLLAAHWVLLGAAFCLFAFPIFGRPKSLEGNATGNFGQHVDALASLLERTGDVEYARRQLDQYRQGQHGGGQPTQEVAVADSTTARHASVQRTRTGKKHRAQDQHRGEDH